MLPPAWLCPPRDAQSHFVHLRWACHRRKKESFIRWKLLEDWLKFLPSWPEANLMVSEVSPTSKPKSPPPRHTYNECTCIYMSLHVCGCTCGCRFMCVHVWRTEVDIQCPPWSLSTLNAEVRPLTEPIAGTFSYSNCPLCSGDPVSISLTQGFRSQVPCLPGFSHGFWSSELQPLHTWITPLPLI